MKTSLFAAALCALAMAAPMTPAFAHETGKAHGHVNKRPHTHHGPTITRQVRISCFRGPFAVTAWDHPEPRFIEDLIGIGYDYTQAWSIGERICKDSAGVANPSSMIGALNNAIAQNPPDH